MSCGASERKTYGNTYKLAVMAKRLTGVRQTVYRESGKDTYGFCEAEKYTEDKGERVIDV